MYLHNNEKCPIGVSAEQAALFPGFVRKRLAEDAGTPLGGIALGYMHAMALGSGLNVDASGEGRVSCQHTSNVSPTAR